jgi:hypothetical protein
MRELAFVASLFEPLFVGLIFHGLCIKFGWLRALAVPIDRRVLFRNRPLFGANKTYRGVLAVALGSAAGYSLQSLAPKLQPPVLRALPLFALVSIGFTLGAAAMFSELLNSFLKRQLEIAPGAAAGGVGRLFFYVFDQVDFPAGGLADCMAVGRSHTASSLVVTPVRVRGASGDQRLWRPSRHARIGPVNSR